MHFGNYQFEGGEGKLTAMMSLKKKVLSVSSRLDQNGEL